MLTLVVLAGELLQQIERDWGVTMEAKPNSASAAATASATASASPTNNVCPIDSMETDDDICFFIDVPGECCFHCLTQTSASDHMLCWSSFFR